MIVENSEKYGWLSLLVLPLLFFIFQGPIAEGLLVMPLKAGLTSTATVLKNEPGHKGRQGADSNDISYRYELPDKAYENTEYFVSDKRVRELKNGDTIPVVYLKEHPETVRIGTPGDIWAHGGMSSPLIPFAIFLCALICGVLSLLHWAFCLAFKKG